MKTGSSGTFVISWSQTEVDGLKAASLDMVTVGATWRWTGEAVRVDGPQGLLLLQGAEGGAEIRKRAARTVRRLVGAAIKRPEAAAEIEDSYDEAPERGFVVTDGHQTFALTLIDVPDTGALLLMMVGELPARGQDLWVVRKSLEFPVGLAGPQAAGGVICFTPETRIATPGGNRMIRNLRPGDHILTRDNGPQEVLWMGQRRMSGARLYAMPHLRPIRFRANALGLYRPDEDLIVSPQHRMLVKGPAAAALFNDREVLVSADDLINDRTIVVDQSLHEVTYVHILLEQHNIVWANGLETESFHPSNTALESIDPVQRGGLLNILPDLTANPLAYGDYARRNITASEAAILRYELAA